jgi:hypothetical protein
MRRQKGAIILNNQIIGSNFERIRWVLIQREAHLVGDGALGLNHIARMAVDTNQTERLMCRMTSYLDQMAHLLQTIWLTHRRRKVPEVLQAEREREIWVHQRTAESAIGHGREVERQGVDNSGFARSAEIL